MKRNNLHFSALAVAVSIATCPVTSVAQSTSEQGTGTVKSLEELVVLGTRRDDKLASESNVPIDVFSSDDLAKSGSTETSRLLEKAIPSMSFPETALNDVADQIRPAVLRGLAPDHTLVLVNGKRRHATAFLNLNGLGRGSSAVDLNMIPTAAISNVQVLRDGAAAQYGSDAIAGVVNIGLKQNSEGGGVNVSYGQYKTTLDGVPGYAGATDNGDGSITLNPASDRDASDGETFTVSAYNGFSLGDDGFLTISGEYRDRSASNRAGVDPRVQYDLVNGGLDSRELAFDHQTFRIGNGDSEDLTLFANFGMPTENGEFYGFASYGSREASSPGFYRRPSQTPNDSNLSIYPNGFLPFINTDTTDFSIAAGFKGDLTDKVGYDVSLVYGSNDIDVGVNNSINASLANSQQAANGGTLSNTQRDFNAGNLKYDQMVLSADFTWDYSDSTLVAFGAEYRDESYKIGAGELASYSAFALSSPFTAPDGSVSPAGIVVGDAGSQVFQGFTPTNEALSNGSRDNIAAYAEIDSNVTDKLNVTAAMRFEDYSDFGSTADGKLSARYQVNDAFSLRGAVSSGFRAPSLAQINFSATGTLISGGGTSLVETLTLPVGNQAAIALGAKTLEAEESSNASLGAVFELDNGLSLTIDWYSIDIDDRIVLSENLSGANVQNTLASNGFTNASAARFFTNIADTETDGLDIVVDYTFDLSNSTLDVSAAYNKNDTEVVGIRDQELFGSRNENLFEQGTPENKIILSADWQTDALGVAVKATRYGEYLDLGPAGTSIDDRTIDSEWIIDLDASYAFNDKLSFTLGVNNVFDTYPDAHPANTTSGGLNNFLKIIPYPLTSPYGFSGRYIYTKIGYNF